MRVKFANGTIKTCTSPIEQRLYRGGEAAGWLCSFKLSDTTTSTELEAILVEDNLSNMTFLDDNNNTLFTVIGYTKATSAIIRHSETVSTVELQLSKGV